ncbi:GNAT family N-acetyltransferase [Streptomyces sp. NPDC059063]|uniref:GNAT family N-acetyltransferase n=1 Tax=unclassified Streptomyces TaxID=2593676 RepID=UPI00369520AB
MPHIREMNEADVEAVSAIRVRGWQSAYAGIVPQPYLDAMTVAADAAQRRAWFTHPGRQSTDLVAVDAGAPVGWISFGPCREQPPGMRAAGEIYALYVLPGLTRRGTGRALLAEAHSRMVTHPFPLSVLWVLRDNGGARRFYERLGYRADGGTQDDDYDGVVLTELRYQRPL